MLKIKNWTQVSSSQVAIPWDKWNVIGQTTYTPATALKELGNNFIVDESFGRKVKGQIVYDYTTGQLIITDDMSGFSRTSMDECMHIGGQADSPATLSEHGLGMKCVICWFGVRDGRKSLEYIKSTKDGKEYLILLPDTESKHAAAFKTIKVPSEERDSYIKRYDISAKGWILQDGPGAQVCINTNPKRWPKSEQHVIKRLDEVVHELEQFYFQKLGKVLDLEVILLNDGEFVQYWKCKRYEPLFSSAIQAKREGYLGKDKKLGPNKYCIDEEFDDTDDTGIKVHLRIGQVPHPKLVEIYFKESQDPDYDPDEFAQNPFGWNKPTMGLTYMKEGVPITWGNFKASRNFESIFGTIDILDDTIETVNTKNDLVWSDEVERFEKKLEAFLKERGIKERVLVEYFTLSERGMEEDLVERLRKKTVEGALARSRMGFETEVRSGALKRQYVCGESGTADVVHYDEDKNVDCIMEIKKEGGIRTPDALFQSLTYGQDIGCKTIIIVSQDASFEPKIQKKVDIWNKIDGWNIQHRQFQDVMDFDPKCPDLKKAYDFYGDGSTVKCKDESCVCKEILKTTKRERARHSSRRGLDS